ncbi:unnamed protein product [Diamesa hyperborea]
MEQFKELKWSWYKYEDERKTDRTSFNFASIKDSDVFNRTINEINKNLVPQDDSISLFKPKPSTSASSEQECKDEVHEYKDPRKCLTHILKCSQDIIKDFEYSSQLTAHEQKLIVASLMSSHEKVIHNSKLLKPNMKIWSKDLKLQPVLKEKYEKEIIQYNKCAEIEYYKNINELNDCLSDVMKSFVIEKWKQKPNNTTDKYQIVTMLLRDAPLDKTTVVTLEALNIELPENEYKFHLIPTNYFPELNRFSTDDLTFHHKLNSLDVFSENDLDVNIIISINALTHLLIDSDEFTVEFENFEDSSFKTYSVFNDIMTTIALEKTQALQEGVRQSLMMNIDTYIIDEHIKVTDNTSTEYKISTIDYQTKSIFQKLKRFREVHDPKNNVWNLTKGTESFKILLRKNTHYYMENVKNMKVPVNISIKMEYQTKYGAEKMSKDELLNEWCHQYLNPNSITCRYRVDAKSLKILSISTLSIDDIELELKESHNVNPIDVFQNLFNLFNCIQRLPQGRYLIKCRNENSCKKLFLYKVSLDDAAKELDCHASIDVQDTFNRKWLPIDSRILTFINMNHQISPCCFPIAKNKDKYIKNIVKVNPKRQKKQNIIEPGTTEGTLNKTLAGKITKNVKKNKTKTKKKK